MPVVIVPPPYQGPTKGIGRVELAATSVRGAMLAMEERYPGFGPQIFSDEGGLHRFVKIFCDGELVCEQELDGSIGVNAEIEVVAAIAGGAGSPAGPVRRRIGAVREREGVKPCRSE